MADTKKTVTEEKRKDEQVVALGLELLEDCYAPKIRGGLQKKGTGGLVSD